MKVAGRYTRKTRTVCYCSDIGNVDTNPLLEPIHATSVLCCPATCRLIPHSGGFTSYLQQNLVLWKMGRTGLYRATTWNDAGYLLIPRQAVLHVVQLHYYGDYAYMRVFVYFLSVIIYL
jgi:hypothetical protein